MAIEINKLNNINSSGNTYVDIHLDLSEIKKDGGKTLAGSAVAGNDIKVDVDSTSIRNSLINIMTTRKGQRPLSLGFGIDLYKFIGDPITQVTATAIATEIKRGIELWEPRVEVVNVYIYPNVDQLMYEIIIVINPIYLDEGQFTLAGNLAKEAGFTFVEQRN